MVGPLTALPAVDLLTGSFLIYDMNLLVGGNILVPSLNPRPECSGVRTHSPGTKAPVRYSGRTAMALISTSRSSEASPEMTRSVEVGGLPRKNAPRALRTFSACRMSVT